MASVSFSPSLLLLRKNLPRISELTSFSSQSPNTLLPIPRRSLLLKASGSGTSAAAFPEPSLLRRPEKQEEDDENDDLEGGRSSRRRRKTSASDDGGEFLDWEDEILGETVPLVGFVRMILHSGNYECGDRLSPEHETIVVEKLLPYHPEFEKKIGTGIDYITVGFHPEFENSKCLFIVTSDGKLVDFSYWKCIKGLIRKKYPLHADAFILRHFRRRSHSEN